MLKTLEQRFWAKVEKTETCWLWRGATMSRGYGAIGAGKPPKSLSAHRTSYEWAKGKIPEGLVIDHLCRNVLCVNPEHLEAVTQSVNVLRGDSPRLTSLRRGQNKTHCKRGHAFVPDNIYNCPDGSRECRACRTYRRLRSV